MYKFTYSRIGKDKEYIEETVIGQRELIKIRRDNFKKNWELLGMVSCSRIKEV